MKTNSNFRYATHALMVAAVSTYLIAPFTAMAVSTPPPRSPSPSNECTKVQAFGQAALTAIQNQLSKVNSDASADATKRLTDEQNFDAKVAADWAKWDAVRQQNFTALNGKAKTAAQQQAVATFEQTVLAAVSTRRGAVTTARNTFRTAVANDASARLNGVDGAIATLQSAVSGAVATAEANCSTESPSTLRAAFVAALKSAKSNYQSTIAALPKLTTEVQALAQTRDSSVQGADNTFHQTVQAAAATLKQALGQK